MPSISTKTPRLFAFYYQTESDVDSYPSDEAQKFAPKRIEATMMKYMPGRVMLCASALLLSLLTLTFAQQPRRNTMRTRRSEPNVLAPELYLENLKLKMTLVDLPGAADPGSYWEGSYQLYFVSEAEHGKALEEAVKRARGPKGGAVALDLDVSDFPKKTLLAEGTFKKRGLSAFKDRIFVPAPIPFRSKIPDAERTKEARLLLSYSVKIFDARLKQTLYRTGLWNAQAPLMQDAAQPERDVARTTVYSSFYVTKTGDVYASQWTREGEDTSW